MENPPEIKNEFDWHNYNESQTREKLLFIRLLKDLTSLLVQPDHKKGRKPVSYSDMVFALALKTYLTFSSRRTYSDLKLVEKMGYLNKAFHFNTLLKYLEYKGLRDVLRRLIEISALPLKQLELDFAMDSTGFGTPRYETWNNVRCIHSKTRLYRKCHCICGVNSNIITSVEITPGYVNDCTQFVPLVSRLKDNWDIREVSADKAYSSRDNLALVVDLGGIPFIPFKSNASVKNKGCGPNVWHTMFLYFMNHREEFLKSYHKRSNIESSFSMIKRRFGNNIRCKKETSQDNEILLKVLCHNICVLVQEIFLNDIKVDFGKCANAYVAHK
jgi:transposase